jgi:hypothetical protein
MKATKAMLVAGIAASVITAGAVGTSVVSAETTGSNVSIVERIATKFGLKEAEVQAVFDEERDARMAERTAEMSDRLQDAVDDGDITADQKKLIETKLAEVQKKRDAEREALQTWADDNNIDMRYLMGGGRHGSDSYLDDAVEEGDITAEQQKLIEEKRAAIEAEREAAREELEQWAEDNDIDLEHIHFASGGRGMGGGHDGRGRF